MTTSAERVDDLRAEARYRRERLALYRARSYGDRPTSAAKLRELERVSAQAADRLRRAEAAEAEADGGSGAG